MLGFVRLFFRLAQDSHLNGTVQNNMDGVKIQLEGETNRVKNFIADIRKKEYRCVLGYQQKS